MLTSLHLDSIIMTHKGQQTIRRVCLLTLSLYVCASVAEIISEGGVRQLYRGGLPEITGLIPRASAALSTLELSRRQFRCAAAVWEGMAPQPDS